MPLRFGLVVITILVTAIGLLSSGFAIQRSMEAEALWRADNELHQGMTTWASQDALYENSKFANFALPSEFFVARLYPDGRWVAVTQEGDEIPNVRQMRFDGVPHNVDSLVAENDTLQRTGRSEWRVLVSTHRDYFVVVAKKLDTDKEFLTRLAAGQISIGTIVLIMVGLFAHVSIQRTLQPLRTVEETAKAIAWGDLDRRVPVLPENTEVGALSRAINVMMEQLQTLIVELQLKEEEMRRFVGDASHELRTPLTSVKGYAELYRSGATEDAKMVLTKIEQEASRMSLLVEDLLSLTRAEDAGLEQQEVDMLELSLSVVSSVQAAYPDRRVHVRNEAEQLPVVTGDAPKLRQVITNLLVNAVKHGGEDAAITLALRRTPAHIILAVEDTGVGIAPEDLEHIFERFYRADSSRTRATGGSGLGLAIVKTIVEAHHGTIQVTSTPGEGTTFEVRLPTEEQYAQVVEEQYTPDEIV
ncbi:HAMP domain-containing histidine kinase [Corynebacterium sp. HS2168-gen11]|uniref:sensor histidine kinase n=1 Tax=Corynebacterium sp. HS2168-gen11 TaxID=2974027 RepID=UPI00216AF323|nr:HAMP domain-containing histidine kinase [Corynebacterium sp. HS2168-gen11]MCS4536074.1 HAMP domain-containing histidine kinase [Corynebacterium sp. HS2168-gen11]